MSSGVGLASGSRVRAEAEEEWEEAAPSRASRVAKPRPRRHPRHVSSAAATSGLPAQPVASEPAAACV